MAENRPDPINLLLSREELLFVLEMLQAQTIPGLDPDPLFGEFTPEQRQLVLTLAQRALRARELLHVQADGELVIHRLLLSAVISCAYPDRALFVYHWPAGHSTPRRFFGHWHGEDVVSHFMPEEALHLFSLLPDSESLVDEFLTAAGYQERNGVAPQAFDTPAEAFAQAQQLASAGDTAGAVAHLGRQIGDPDAAATLVDTLAASPQVTIFQVLTPVEDDPTPQRRDVTLLQGGKHNWLVTPAVDDDQLLHIQSARRETLRQLIID
jgi:hypothetical protein